MSSIRNEARASARLWAVQVGVSLLVTSWIVMAATCTALLAQGHRAPDPASAGMAAIRDALAKDDYRTAEQSARELLATTERQLGGDALEVAEVLDLLVASLCRSRSQSMSATLPLAERALAIKERALGLDDARLGPSLTNLGLVYRELDRLGDAQRVLERGLRIQEAASGPNDPSLGPTLQALATVLTTSGAYDEAKKLYERDLAIATATLPPKDRALGQKRYNFARLLARMGDLDGARRQYEQALAIIVENDGAEAIGAAYVSNGLGTVLEELGELTEARARTEAAYRIAVARLGPQHVLSASCVNNLGRLCGEIGDWKDARRYYEAALEIHLQTDGPDHSRTAWAKARLADLDYMEGNYKRALELNEATLPILEKARGPEHPEIATRLWRYALVLEALGREAEAEKSLERALRITESALSVSHEDAAVYVAALGSVAARTGRLAEAQSRYERAVAIFDRNMSSEHPGLAPILGDLAAVLQARGELDPAIEVALRSESIARENIRRTIRALPEREALGFRAIASHGLDVGLSIAVDGTTAATRSRVFEAAIASRALVLDEMATRRSLLSRTGDAETARVTQSLARANHDLGKWILQGPGTEDPVKHAEKIARARAAKDEAERTLATHSAIFRKQQGRQSIGLEQIARELPRASVLVSYFQYEQEAKTLQSASKSKPVVAFAAFVLRAGEKQPVAVALGPADDIRALVAKSLADMRRDDDSPNAERQCRQSGEALRLKIWDPVAPHLRGAELILVVPDGDLNLLNFSALPDGERDYLIDRQARIHYLAADRDLVTGPSATTGKGLLAVGGCDFDATPLLAANDRAPRESEGVPTALRGPPSRCTSFAELQFRPLAGTADEAKQVAEIWTRTQSKTSPTTLLTSGAAAESRIKSAAPAARVCHLATHGFFLGGACAPVGNAERGTGGLVAAADPSTSGQLRDDPLLYSGLALAGANHRSQAFGDEDDGILTAEEVAALNLQGTEWAVLSACGTGLGDVRSGEGVFGLRRAFQVAGARTVIMSLWSVRDQETRDWMIRLYTRRLQDRMNTATSVWSASRDILRERRAAHRSTHPFYWAGFVAAGDWR